MTDPVAPLVLDLLEWIGREPRPYREVMDAWRTSCPRLPVWETANEQGYLEHTHHPGSEAQVALSERGRKFLLLHRPRHGAQPVAPALVRKAA
jgi:D-3-phosphoglycerate dehydrogenase